MSIIGLLPIGLSGIKKNRGNKIYFKVGDFFWKLEKLRRNFFTKSSSQHLEPPSAAVPMILKEINHFTPSRVAISVVAEIAEIAATVVIVRRNFKSVMTFDECLQNCVEITA